MTTTTSKLYDKCKQASAIYARTQVQERRAPLECLPSLTKAHLEGTMEGFDLAISLLVRFRTEVKEAERANERQISLPLADGER